VDRSKITLLHINHGWRAKTSDADARFVRMLGKKWAVPVKVVRLKRPTEALMRGQSWEEQARAERKKIYERCAGEDGFVLTAHQADDLAETILWRLFTGVASTHGGGIFVRHGVELRPLLKVRKKKLIQYLNEEKQEWREDATNHEGRFLRSRMRQILMPAMEELFPLAVEHLVELGLTAQRDKRWVRKEASGEDTENVMESLLKIAGVRMRRAHWGILKAKLAKSKWVGELHLGSGWRLSCERERPRGSKKLRRRWVLVNDK
jgi:tRNA(Ile)-lysidine synthase